MKTPKEQRIVDKLNAISDNINSIKIGKEPIATFEDEATIKAQDIALRPKGFHDFIGQHNNINNLKVYIESAKIRKQPLDHTLLYGPPGLGKTTLANIIAFEMDSQIKTTSAPLITKTGDLAALLTNLNPFDILFIDEIHRLSSQVEEILYSAMEDFRLDIMIGTGPSAKVINIDIPPFTLIGATTRTGLLTNPLRDRFGIMIRFEHYTQKELMQLIQRNMKLLNILLTEESIVDVARRSRGTPRIAGRILRRIRDYSIVNKQPQLTHPDVTRFLAQLNINQLGLDAFDQQYIRLMKEQFKGGPVGIDTLALSLNEDKGTLEEVVEPYLLQMNLIQKTPKGRILTDYGWNL